MLHNLAGNILAREICPGARLDVYKRQVQEVAADLQTVPVEEIYGGLLHIFLEKLAAFASGYAPRCGNTG